ncbi:MAG: DUF6786 family protein [Saprospiraceae bacterium]|nr:hypothetical protein [Lewinella sp.]
MRHILYFSLLLTFLYSCKNASTMEETTNASPTKGYISFQDDVDFLKQYTDVEVLTALLGNGMVAVSGNLQGRVMTSTSNGEQGRSYGWINRALFESRDTLDHMNPFGGEERIWLGPEGGQYSIFFPQGAEFVFEDWQTPPLIDTEPYDLVQKTAQKAVYTKSGSLTNYSGFTFEFNIKRSIEILTTPKIFQTLGIAEKEGINSVGYRTTNELTNTGEADWQKETGLLSIWLLGMFTPTEATMVVIPFEADAEGPIVNDTYFGKVPAERLKTGENVLFFSGDGKYRSKIGLPPGRAKNILGAYDPLSKTLTIVKFSKPKGVNDYVNSLWEMQDDPYGGDVVNSYNDGPVEPGGEAMGPFYELETSSPALALKAGESGTHTQQTYHFSGNEGMLNEIAELLLGVSLSDIEWAFE